MGTMADQPAYPNFAYSYQHNSPSLQGDHCYSHRPVQVEEATQVKPSQQATFDSPGVQNAYWGWQVDVSRFAVAATTAVMKGAAKRARNAKRMVDKNLSR